MQDRPDLAELIDSVRRFLDSEVVPTVSDQRLRFRARVAANVLAVASRERAMEAELLQEELRRLEGLLGKGAADGTGGDPRAEVDALNTELARRIRSGAIAAEPGSAVWEHLRKTAVEKLRVANPGYLKRVGEGGGQRDETHSHPP